jgi:hypothetical protein
MLFDNLNFICPVTDCNRRKTLTIFKILPPQENALTYQSISFSNIAETPIFLSLVWSSSRLGALKEVA